VNRNRKKDKKIREGIRSQNVIGIRNKKYQRYQKWLEVKKGTGLNILLPVR